MVAARQIRRGKPIRSWKWIGEDAIALRDRRLAGLPAPATVVPFAPQTRAPTWRDDEREAAAGWARSIAKLKEEAGCEPTSLTS
jgi:hypothetical protein